MIFTARNIKADKALTIGLVNAVVPQEELMATALKMANGICKNAPIAVAQAKKQSTLDFKQIWIQLSLSK